jgi:hypothetical protein
MSISTIDELWMIFVGLKARNAGVVNDGHICHL